MESIHVYRTINSPFDHNHLYQFTSSFFPVDHPPALVESGS